ncbi:MAG: hypothetical protein WC580_06615 [Agrococcus sp.]
MDAEIELRFLAIFFAALLLVQALLLLSWAAAKGVRKGLATLRPAHRAEATVAPAAPARPTT